MFEGLEEQEIITRARRLFEETLLVWNEWFINLRRDFRFHSGGENQWDAQDLQVLREQRRPALTFNLMHVVINEMIGAHEDSKREAKAVPVGAEDQLRAELFNTLANAIRRQTDEDAADSETFERGVIGGISCSNIDVNPKPGDPREVEVSIDPIHPFETMIDPAAKRRDMRDADFAFWQRWVPEAAFKREFPDHALQIDLLLNLVDAESGSAVREIPENSLQSIGPNFTVESIASLEDPNYYDRNRRRVRVIHLEYRKAIKKYYGFNSATRRPERISPENFAKLNGSNVPIETTTVWENEIWWLEFTGLHILFHGKAPLPHRGFSIKPFICDKDHLTGEPRGIIRNLIDPQREINKRHSQTLHLLNEQAAPGLIAESNAFIDKAQAENALRTPGVIAEAQTGAIAGQKLMWREVPRFPQGPAEMMKTGLEMFFRISGVHIDTLVGQRAANEAPTTALLRHRRSIMAMTKITKNYQSYQRRMLEAKLDIIVNLIPDAQLEKMLGNSERWKVRNRVIIDAQEAKEVPLHTLSDMDWDVELDVAVANTTIALLQLQIMMSMQQFGTPMAPEVMIDQLSVSRDTKLKLKQHVQKQQAMQMQQIQAQSQVAQAELKSEMALRQADLKLKAMSADEKKAHNVALETIAALKSERDFLAKLGAIYEKADTNEKKQLFSVLETIIEVAAHQEAAAQTPNPRQKGAVPGLTAAA